MASVDVLMMGVGLSSNASLPGPWYTSAFMVIFLSDFVASIASCHPISSCEPTVKSNSYPLAIRYQAKESQAEAGWPALRSSASRNGPFGLCQAEAFGNSFAD